MYSHCWLQERGRAAPQRPPLARQPQRRQRRRRQPCRRSGARSFSRSWRWSGRGGAALPATGRKRTWRRLRPLLLLPPRLLAQPRAVVLLLVAHHARSLMPWSVRWCALDWCARRPHRTPSKRPAGCRCLRRLATPVLAVAPIMPVSRQRWTPLQHCRRQPVRLVMLSLLLLPPPLVRARVVVMPARSATWHASMPLAASPRPRLPAAAVAAAVRQRRQPILHALQGQA